MAANIFFTSADHKARFLVAMRAIGKLYVGKLDPEYAAAIYVLTSSAGNWNKAQSYVDHEGIDFEALLAEVDYSGSYRVLIQLAWNLFNSGTALSPVELVHLDTTNFTIALTALQIRRASLPLSELTSEAELYNLEIEARNRAPMENREKPWLPLQPGEEF